MFPPAGVLTQQTFGYQGTLLDNLLSWWPFNETTGTRVDAHGSTNLTTSGSSSYAAGKQGNAFDTLGTGHLYATDPAAFDFGDTSVTIAFWLYVDTTGANRGVFGKTTTATDGFLFLQSTSTLLVYIQGSGTTTKTITTGQWDCYIWTYNHVSNVTSLQKNLDTASTGSYASGFGTNAVDLTVGKYGTSNVFDGKIDELAVWNRVLTTDEKAEYYNSGNGMTYPG